MVAAKRYFRSCLAILGICFLPGCIPIPAPPHGLGVVPDMDAIKSFRLQHSTRADVLLKLGEPRYRLDGDRFLIYEWEVAYGYLVIGGPGAAFPLPVSFPHYLCLEFGADSRLVRQDHLIGSIYGKPDKAIRKCMNPSEVLDEVDAK
jgi:hypothetical protein